MASEMITTPAIDLAQAAWHFEHFMAALGHTCYGDAHLQDTPRRVSLMYAELLNGKPFTFTTFPAEGDQMIVVKDIPFTSFCAHHFLPFTGHAHIGYVPGQTIAGLSKFARAIQHCAAAPQVQERLTEQAAEFIEDHLNPLGVAVVIEARHECMELRGVRAVGATTVTSAMRGIFKTQDETRAEFLDLVLRRS